MRDRDYYYVTDRLSAPDVAAGEAYGRLRDKEQHRAAARLMAAMQSFQDECRSIRRELEEERRHLAQNT